MGLFVLQLLRMINTSSTIASISFRAWLYFSGGPSTNTLRTPVSAVSLFATWIFAPLSCCSCLIVSPPFPMISPTASFGTGRI